MQRMAPTNGRAQIIANCIVFFEVFSESERVTARVATILSTTRKVATRRVRIVCVVNMPPNA